MGIDILGIDIMGVDILGIDILALPRNYTMNTYDETLKMFVAQTDKSLSLLCK